MRTVLKGLSVGLFGLLAACSADSSSAHDSKASSSAPAAASDSNGGSSAASVTPVGQDHSAAINALVAGAGQLTTDKQADFDPVQNGDPTQKLVTGTDGTYQCTYTNYSLTKVPEKFVALNPNADVLWPGSLVQGKSMAGGILDPIPVKRAPGTITLTLAAGSTGPVSKTMDQASLAAATQAQNDILAGYDAATPAKFSYDFQSIYSSQQLSVAVDANVKGTDWAAAASLKVDQDDAKSRYLIQFTQEYFTMAFEPPQGAAGVFDPSVTADDLAPYAQDGNPPVYIASVTYGRIFYLLFESTASQHDLEVAVSGSYSGAVSVDANAAASYKTIINSATIKSYGLGGNAESAIGAVTGDDQFAQIKTFLTTGANFSKENPGVPISYTVRNLADSTEVKLALTTDYTAKDCTSTAKFCDNQQHVLDACGVCGGQGNTCSPCSAQHPQVLPGNGDYVTFNIAQGNNGDTVSFPDGNYYHYASAYCHREVWGNIQYTCKNGTWTQTAGNVATDNWCTQDSNAGWSNNVNLSISTGYQP